ncbi:hypothetical protein J2Z79_003508 [Symbiobacterium terraclitae]|uniref:Uncharacterized protein n=1 Tax=Symbiobacterium terraclitae TaxID=557451 RepID=A0ABS4JWZ8_9FIRM|nr:hypothetical protein [Symbiobacterium terraclitae]MBP2020054.1 hypothetical protein [Symbiobacterium terraclitae]
MPQENRPSRPWRGSDKDRDSSQLTEGHLNRALLARRHLLERAAVPVAYMVERLAGLNAQEPQHAYVSL